MSLSRAWWMRNLRRSARRCASWRAIRKPARVSGPPELAHTRIRELSTQEVERRVAHCLLRLIRKAGRPTPDGLLVDFPVTRQDIAEMTGTTLHTVSRLMSAWETLGLVKSARRKIIVVDRPALAALAEGDEA